MKPEDVRSSDSTDARVTQELIETLVDGQEGFGQAAEKLATDGHTQAASRLKAFATSRKRMADDLRAMAARYGDRVDSDGSTMAALHRGWISLKDALTGGDADAVINAAVAGEEHAVSEYEKALEEEISIDLRSKVQEQLTSVRAVKEELEGMSTNS